jgi:hypothetical protein
MYILSSQEAWIFSSNKPLLISKKSQIIKNLPSIVTPSLTETNQLLTSPFSLTVLLSILTISMNFKSQKIAKSNSTTRFLSIL